MSSKRMIPESEKIEFLDKVKEVIIDKEGLTFKYILIKVQPKDTSKSKQSDSNITKILVRGFENCYYHCDILEEVETKEKIEANGFLMNCLGGGRIRHNHKKIHVYGYSQGYGKADHDLTKGLLQVEFPDYEITVSDEGY